MKKNNKIIKYVIFIIAIILIAIFTVSTTTYAKDLEWNLQIGEEDGTWTGVSGWADGITGLLAYPAKILVLVVLIIIKFILSGFISTSGGEGFTLGLTPADIIFNKLPITTVNFFNKNTSNLDFITSLQNSVSLWYVTIRNISVIILLGILLYVGIRMAISTVAAEEAKYKKMFKDLTVSLVLVYVLQYIMIIVIDINNVLVNILKEAFGVDSGNQALSDVMTYLYKEAWSVSLTQGWGCTILYGILITITLLFLIMYLKRVIITAFLIIISPLITITYSIDKMGDGKSQALNNWLKEFCYNILIQPFHCIIYGVLVLTCATALSTDKSIATLIMTIVAMLFIFKAEDLVKKIFGVQPSSLGSVVAGGAFALSVMNLLTKKNNNSKKSSGRMTNDKTPNFSGKDYGDKNGTSGANNGGNSNGGNSNELGPNGGQGSNGGSGNGSSSSNGGIAPTPPQRGFGEKFARTVGKGAKGYAIGSAKVGAALVGAILGAGTGDTKGIIAGANFGKSISDKTTNHWDNQQYRRDTNANEQVMAAEYSAWEQEQGIDNEEELLNRTETIMNADLEKGGLSEGDLKYRQYLDSLSKHYQGGGEDEATAKQHVLNTIKETQGGWITPGKHKSTGGYERQQPPQETQPQGSQQTDDTADGPRRSTRRRQRQSTPDSSQPTAEDQEDTSTFD